LASTRINYGEDDRVSLPSQPRAFPFTANGLFLGPDNAVHNE